MLEMIRFKTDRIKNEWSGAALNPALRVIVVAASLWLIRKTGKAAIITGLFRTRDEQRAIYPNEPDKRSTHEYGRAADIRVMGVLTDAQAHEWEAWINTAFAYYGKAGSRTALLHEVGNLGGHMHIQVGPEEPEIIE